MVDIPTRWLRARRRIGEGRLVLSRVGFFRTAQEVIALRRPTAAPDETAVLRYLEAGESLVVTGSWADDLIDPNRKRICQYAINTDGVWIWPSILPYYLARYHVELPKSFLQHMRVAGWTAPRLGEDTLDAVVDQYMLEESMDLEESDD